MEPSACPLRPPSLWPGAEPLLCGPDAPCRPGTPTLARKLPGYCAATDDGDEGPGKEVHFDAGDVGQEDYFDFGSDDEPSSEDEEDAELRSHPSSSPTRLKVTDEGGPSPPASPPRRGLFGRKK